MTRQVITAAIAQQKKGITGTTPPTDQYQERLLKLIPAEVVSVYLAVFQILENKTEWVHWLVFVLLFIGNILYKKQAGVTDWKQFLISSIAYVLWVFSLGGPVKEFEIFGEQSKSLSAILVPIYTLFVPLLYK